MLSRRDIEKELGKGINLFPLRIKNIKENSINLSIGRNAWSLGSGSVISDKDKGFILAPSKTEKSKHTIHYGCDAIIRNGSKAYLVLLPHVTTIVETSEVIGVSNYIGGTIHSKVGIVAQGVGHIGTMLGPCFCGHLMISLHNVTDKVIAIPAGETFISIVFHYLDTPSSITHNSNISGHVDKLAELGIKIDPETREYLTAEWKCNIDGIKNKMLASEEYADYKKQIKQQRFRDIKGYFNIPNIILAILCLGVVVVFGMLAYRYDKKLGNAVWSERYWTVILTGIVVPIVLAVGKLFKKR